MDREIAAHPKDVNNTQKGGLRPPAIGGKLSKPEVVISRAGKEVENMIGKRTSSLN
jgi:hypothetical protein